MINGALSVLLLATQPVQLIGTYDLDPFMLYVTEGCLLPDLSSFDPNNYFAQQGWQKEDGMWVQEIGDARIVVKINWPATERQAASCSFYSPDFEPEAYRNWFIERIGKPNDHTWDEAKRFAIWKINTNDHSVGIYTARDKSPETGEIVSVVHILQNKYWK